MIFMSCSAAGKISDLIHSNMLVYQVKAGGFLCFGFNFDSILGAFLCEVKTYCNSTVARFNIKDNE